MNKAQHELIQLAATKRPKLVIPTDVVLDGDSEMRRWVELVCFYFDVTYGPNSDLNGVQIPEFTPDEFKLWQRANNLKTYNEVGCAFGIQRQAVYNWHRRSIYPQWLGLACKAHDIKISAMPENNHPNKLDQ